MNSRFAAAIIIVCLTVGLLIYSAVNATAKSVVTVAELTAAGTARENVRLGARVADAAIGYEPDGEHRLQFSVHDIQPQTAGASAPAAATVLPVVYGGTMPDMLKAGRDVILEGNYDGREFVAKNLVTQCPSKYVPPVPGAEQNGHGYKGGQVTADTSGVASGHSVAAGH
jgi:cytochrome c-type biogenesis protein CcmE